MRLAYAHLFTLPRHNLSFAAGAFRISAPKVWNSLPLVTRPSVTVALHFQEPCIKDILSSVSIHRSLATSHQCALSPSGLWHYIYIYLLIYFNPKDKVTMEFGLTIIIVSADNAEHNFSFRPKLI